jgi:hypothetical protein
MTRIAFAVRRLLDLRTERAHLAALLTGLSHPAEVDPGQAGACRPRACAGLGLVAEEWLAAALGRVWISVTGYGRDDPAPRVPSAITRQWPAGWSPGPRVTPVFCGGAIADPLTGILAALVTSGWLVMCRWPEGALSWCARPADGGIRT